MKRLNPVLWRRLEGIARDETERLLLELPPLLRAKARAIPVVMEAAPTSDMVRDGVEPDLLGLFVGGGHAGGEDETMPAEILLFLANLWDYADGSAARFREEVRRTYLHELGHYLGLDEEQLEDRDLD